MYGLLLSRQVSAQIHVMSPLSLVKKLGKHGRVEGSTATFGAPFYGDRVLGRIVYGDSKGEHHCKDKDYDVPRPDTIHNSPSSSHDQARLINIVMVRRGVCSFVTKVRVAAAKGAHAVIIVDKEDSKLTSKDLQKIIVADDGYGNTIRIPSVLISKQEGQALIDAARAEEIIVELAWDIPTNKVVGVDIWMSSGSHDSQQFLANFADARETLNEVMKFTPHYYVFSADPTLGGYSGLCSDSSAKYCAEDPDGSGLVTGKNVLDEDVRQLCIHDLTKVPRSKEAAAPTVFYAEKWWSYVKQLPERCPLDSDNVKTRFGDECAERLLADIGGSDLVDKVKKCMRDTGQKKLEYQRVNRAWSPRAVRVNGWRFNGMLDADLVTRAVCSGFIKRPDECTKLLKPRDPTKRYEGSNDKNSGVSVGTVIAAGAAMCALACIAACVYKRFIEKRMGVQIREEVMLEVKNQMAQYSKLPGNA